MKNRGLETRRRDHVAVDDKRQHASESESEKEGSDQSTAAPIGPFADCAVAQCGRGEQEQQRRQPPASVGAGRTSGAW